MLLKASSHDKVYFIARSISIAGKGTDYIQLQHSSSHSIQYFTARSISMEGKGVDYIQL